jgi:hypothetical protein
MDDDTNAVQGATIQPLGYVVFCLIAAIVTATLAFTVVHTNNLYTELIGLVSFLLFTGGLLPLITFCMRRARR